MPPAALQRLAGGLESRRAQGLQRVRRTVQGPCGPWQATDAAVCEAPAALLSFCSNDYLGLASHPVVVDALREGARQDGAGSGASALISGHGLAHATLEADVATFMSPVVPGAAALHFGTGYLANLAVVTALGGADTALFCDALNHASLIDGARLARAAVVVYPHGDAAALGARLAECTTPSKVIVTDGVFSMDGDVAPLAALLALAERHDALLVVDDAHGFGVLGPQGRGAAAAAGLCSDRIVAIGTFGKAAGVAGAFVAAHSLVIEWLIQTGRSYIYTTAPPPALAHAVSASLRLVAGDVGDRARTRLRALVEQLRHTLPGAVAGTGWRLLDSSTPVQALLIGDSDAASAVSGALERHGVRAPAIRPPTVAPGSARLRLALSAAHTTDDVERLVACLRAVAGER